MTTEMLTTQFQFTHFVIRKNAEDITHEESLAGPQRGGNCLNWVLGHILYSRDGILKTLGGEPVLAEGRTAPYRRGSSPLTEETAAGWDELLAALETTQERIAAALPKLDDARLATLVPAAIGGGEQPLAQFLASLAFHEAYHAGQMGVLRRVAGKPGAIQ